MRWGAEPVIEKEITTVTKEKQEMPEEQNEQSMDEELDLGDDVFEFDMPDIPIPEDDAGGLEVEDTFKADSGFKMCFLGIGRGGSRLAETFYNIGYRRVCVVNTAKPDLDEIKIDEKNKLWLGVGGAGNNRRKGAHYVRENYEEIIDLMRLSFGSSFDRIMVCVAGGGGTGSGGLEVAVEIANAYAEHVGVHKKGENTKVGVMIALPSNSEKTYMRNAYEAMQFVDKKLKNKEISPVVIVDNERGGSLYASATIGDVWYKINQSIASIFHLFNILCEAPTRHIAMDKADLETVLDSGVITYGITPIKDSSGDGLSRVMTDNIKNNVLCGGIDLATASIAGCVLSGPKQEIENMTAADIDKNCFAKLERIIEGGIVHRGIYTTNKTMSVCTIVGGLELPKERLEEIAKLSGKVDWDE